MNSFANPSQPSGDRLALLYRLSQTLNSSLDLDEVLNRVMDKVIARAQASLLPRETPQVPGWEFAACWRPAREVTGDSIDPAEGDSAW